MEKKIINNVRALFKKGVSVEDKINILNKIKSDLHSISPFKDEPVDCVLWEKSEKIIANDYNPNKVAPPEMELLEVSIMNDGYTQPIVSWRKDNGDVEVVDGFHRSRVGKESKVVNQRVNGFLPVVNIRTKQSGKNDRIASTIRHNRARGKHQVDAMSEIVIELKNRNWTNSRISKQLGMDEEEVLRLCQISGLEHLFSDNDFSKAWVSSDSGYEFEPLTDAVEQNRMDIYKIPNENDETRIFHTYDKWECHKAGFYKNKKKGWTDQQCREMYVKILGNEKLFAKVLGKVISEWKYSCEHYLTNKSMNRIAWLGQAAVCYESGVPSAYSSAWEELDDNQKQKANKVALKYLNLWLEQNGLDTLEEDAAMSVGRQIELY